MALPKCNTCSLQHAPAPATNEAPAEPGVFTPATPEAIAAACLEAQATLIYTLLTRTGEPHRCSCGALIFWCFSPTGTAIAYDELARPHETTAAECKAKTYGKIANLAELRQHLYLFLERMGERGRCGGNQGKKDGCRQTVYWFTHHTGKKAPYTEHALNHFADCENRESFRKKKAG